LLFSVPGGGGSEMAREMDGIERIRAGPAQGGKRPEDMTPQELHGILWQVLSFRDSGALVCLSFGWRWSDVVWLVQSRRRSRTRSVGVLFLLV
jgi:hypothetical protein